MGVSKGDIVVIRSNGKGAEVHRVQGCKLVVFLLNKDLTRSLTIPGKKEKKRLLDMSDIIIGAKPQ